MPLQTIVLKTISELHIFECVLMLLHNLTPITDTHLILIPLAAFWTVIMQAFLVSHLFSHIEKNF